MPELLTKLANYRLKKKLNKINIKEKKVSSLTTHKSPIYDKEVPKAAIDAFFEKLENGTFQEFFDKRVKDEIRSKREPDWIRKGQIVNYKDNRLVFPITKSVLGTIRIFYESHLNKYLKKTNAFYKIVEKHKNNFKNFEIQPINILGVKKLKTGEYALLEKVYSSVSISDIYSNRKNRNRYFTFGSKFFKNRNIDVTTPEFDKLLQDTHSEYKEVFKQIDSNTENILVLDYNPKTKKLLLGPIDFFGANRKSIPN